jgi:DNA-binding IclR family transcriptional regulator
VSTERPKSTYSAPAAACAAEVLLALARSDAPLALGALTERTGRTRSLVYRVIAELEARELVRRDRDGRLALGVAAIELGGAYSASVPLMTSVRRTLRRLADTTGETASLGVLQGDHVLSLVREEGVRSVVAVSHVGKRLPVNAVALGKALLARLPDERVAAQLGGADPLPALTPRTITSLDALYAELARVRASGVAEEHGEAVSGRCCVAVAADAHGRGFDAVAISLSMDEARWETTRDVVVPALLDARDRVERDARSRAAIGDAPPDFALHAAVDGG